jgi:hypothetical protein
MSTVMLLTNVHMEKLVRLKHKLITVLYLRNLNKIESCHQPGCQLSMDLEIQCRYSLIQAIKKE